MRSSLFALSAILFFTFSVSCTGPEGPPGPEGIPGPQGPRGYPGEEGFVFEFENVDFLAPDYGIILPFPEDFQALPSDAVLVYALWDTQIVDDEEVDIWRLLPQSSFLNGGELVYNYEHTYFDVEVFLEADFNLGNASLGPGELDDWIIRVVVVPAQYLSNGRLSGEVDFKDYDAVKSHYGLPEVPRSVSKQVYKRPELK